MYFPASIQGCPEHQGQPFNVSASNGTTTCSCAICGKILYVGGIGMAVGKMTYLVDASAIPPAMKQPEIELRHLGYLYKVALAKWAELPIWTPESDKAQDEVDEAMTNLCAFVVKEYVDR